jgi:Spy/CpxP family protein refolding chaperone
MVNKSFFGALSLLICLSSFARADDDKSTKPVDSKKDDTKKSDTKKDDAKSDDDSDALEALPTGKIKGRLPNGFTKLKITDPQRQKIYSIQANFKSQIDDLQKQLADLQVKRDTEIMNVLTDDQKKLYVDLFGTATKSRSSKKTMLDEATADTKPADDAKTPATDKAAASDKKTSTDKASADKSTAGTKTAAAK